MPFPKFLYSCLCGVPGSGRNQERVWYGCLGFLRSLYFSGESGMNTFFPSSMLNHCLMTFVSLLACDSACLNALSFRPRNVNSLVGRKIQVSNANIDFLR